MYTQTKYLDLPLSEDNELSIECIISGTTNQNPKTRMLTPILLDNVLDNFFLIPRSLIRELKLTTQFQRSYHPQRVREACQLELLLPFSMQPIEITAIVSHTVQDCCANVHLLDQICSSLEILVEQKIVRLYGLKI